MTKDEAIRQAHTDYAAALGTVIKVDTVYGYTGHDSVEHHAPDTSSFEVRVIATPSDAIEHWNDEWLDPYWDVELLTPIPDLRSTWIDGPSYQTTK